MLFRSIDDQCTVRAVLSFSVGELLHRLDGVAIQKVFPTGHSRGGPITVDPANGYGALFAYFFQNSCQAFRRGIIPIYQKRNGGVVYFFH